MRLQLKFPQMEVCVLFSTLIILGSSASHLHDGHATRSSSIALPPSVKTSRAPTTGSAETIVSPPSIAFHRHRHRHRLRRSVPGPSYHSSHLQPRYKGQGESGPLGLGHLFQPPFPPSEQRSSSAPAPAPAPTMMSSQAHMPALQPAVSPSGPSPKKMKTPPSVPPFTLPPPPLNEDCTTVTCTEPLTYTPSGSPCACVWPIQVKLHLSVELYTFFPLVSELAEEIASSVLLNRKQVRVIGANSAPQQQGRTTVLVNLVPQGMKFNKTTALSIYEKFWHKRVFIKASLFGAHEVIYVRYPGLPPSPPVAPSDVSTTSDRPNPNLDSNGMALKPLGVDVPKRKKNEVAGSLVTVIVLSCLTAFVVLAGISWLLLLRREACAQPEEILPPSDTSTAKSLGTSGPGKSFSSEKMADSGSMSFASGRLTHRGFAKMFTLNEIERATNKFDSSRIVGEGGFGLVYRGTLDDEREVAVKVLKRDDKRGSREFLAEVEMLSRLHHRNLVKLIGICSENDARCLVYELIPNGSVESHLHGVDKVTEPLDWDSRMKIALGAARGLAYLHEDSNPRVIHRDFKCSNILLEHDFTPKVADFGLARTALDEGNKLISTHVMGTFGYLAPEYAMTGHLLVKSDVYSYGVVLLELLTGRKPVDLSQPLGQENLVAWARPLLSSREGLETIVDPDIGSNVSFDTVAKVAAIASMCVQPEASHRPFMGEVVQALKLVCNEFDETKEPRSRSSSQGNLSTDMADRDRDAIRSNDVEVSHSPDLLSENGSCIHTRMALSEDLLIKSMEFEDQDLSFLRRDYNSEPLTTGRRKRILQRLRSLSRGSKDEHRFSFKLWARSR